MSYRARCARRRELLQRKKRWRPTTWSSMAITIAGREFSGVMSLDYRERARPLPPKREVLPNVFEVELQFDLNEGRDWSAMRFFGFREPKHGVG